MSHLISVTTLSRNQKHLADANAMSAYWYGGRFGLPLCDAQTHASVYDQAATDGDARHWGDGPAVRIDELPPCDLCEHTRLSRSRGEVGPVPDDRDA